MFFTFKSGIRISTVQSGTSSLHSRTTSLKISAPPSFSSSLLTEVITACLNFNSFIDSSNASWFVQIEFRWQSGFNIAKTAGSRTHIAEDHKGCCPVIPAFCNVGQLASSQTVLSFCLRIRFRTSLKLSPTGNFIFNQSGLLRAEF